MVELPKEIKLNEITWAQSVTASIGLTKRASIILTRTDGEVLHPLEAQEIDLLIVSYGSHYIVMQSGAASIRGHRLSVRVETKFRVNAGTVVLVIIADKGDDD